MTTRAALRRALLNNRSVNGGSSSQPPSFFGVNLSGAEFAPWNGQTWPSAADWQYLASLGIKTVRLPFAWESMQTSLGAALNTTYLAGLKAAVALGWSYGIKSIVDCHNFGCYMAQADWIANEGLNGYAGNEGTVTTGVNVLGDGTLTTANLVDLWTKLATALVGNPGVAGYDIMNEPTLSIIGTNLLATPNYFSNSTGAQPWSVQNGAAPTILGAGTNPVSAAYGPAWTISSGTGFGAVVQTLTLAAVPYTLSLYAKVASGTQTLTVQLGSAADNDTVTTAWQRFTKTVTPTAGAVTVEFAVHTGTTNQLIEIADAQLELGSSASTYQPSPWTPIAQAVVTAIRTVDATTPIYPQGLNSSATATWDAYNYEMAGMTGGPFVFQGHCYFDAAAGSAGSGEYSSTYTAQGVTSSSGVTDVTPFVAWLQANSLKGFVGEFGIPNSVTDNNAAWFPLQANFLSYLRANVVPGAGWFYGSNKIQSGNILNIARTSGVTDPRLAQIVT